MHGHVKGTVIRPCYTPMILPHYPNVSQLSRGIPTVPHFEASVTPQGLYEFQVLPYWLTNVPGDLQCLMERVLSGLNPEDGPDYVEVYIDDLLIFSHTLEDHLEHLRHVIHQIQAPGLKVRTIKHRFNLKDVKYLGDIVTPDGLKTNERLVTAIKDFPYPQNISEL